MPKINQIKEQIASIQNEEGDGFEFDKLGLTADLGKYDSQNSSTIIKVITVLGAFIGSSFLLTFFFANKIFQQPPAMLLFGIALMILSIALSNTSKMLLFETSFVAFLIYGGIILGIGLNGYKLNDSLISLCFFLVGLLVFLFSKNEIQILLGVVVAYSSLFGVISFQKFFWAYHIYNLVLTIGLVTIYLKEAELITTKYFAIRYNALKNGMIVIFLMCMSRVSIKAFSVHEIPYNWLSAIAPIVAILFMLGMVLNKIGVQKKSTILLVQIVTLLILLLTIVFPAISASMLIILLCFWVNYRSGYIIGIMALCYFICQFYYDLSFTLLVKSELLFASGILFGLVYFFSSKKLVENEKV